MKMTAKEFRKYVSDIRRMMPRTSNGRKVVVLSEETKAGKRVIDMGSRWDGNTLSQVYDKWSSAKEDAFNSALEMYCNSRHGNSFGICSHNTYGFTVSWLHDDGMTVLTPTTEYLVIFNE